ncbi:PTS sugar transporter subunit IIA [Enterococcus sp. AZ072]|uniref:PTS sugar transporter subunit IIA n=1 Tax=unclassified Enterococcus TaxID=2608891 RepID=UPI003D2844FC
MKILLINEEVENWQDAIRKTSKKLYDEGFVNDEFGNQCIEREKKYPTGLNTLAPIAIPHTDSDFVHESAICLLKPRNKVSFVSMEDSSTKIEVNYILNLAIKDNKQQVPVLSKVIGLFNDTDLINHVNEKGSTVLKAIIEKEFN